jgi:hypothetical protein
MTQSVYIPTSNRSNQNSTDNYSFHLQKQSPTAKTSIRPQIVINNQVPSSASSFQRNSVVRQTVPGNSQNQRPTSASSATNSIDSNQTPTNLTNVYMNKSFILRQQRSNLTSKPVSRQPLKSTPSVPSTTNPSGQMNRAVELRRARAQAKIEELTHRTKKQLTKPTPQIDIMSASWHSSASSTTKKDLTNPRATARTNAAPQRQDLYSTRTISSSPYHRSSSTSPNPPAEKPSRYRKVMRSSITDEQNQRMTASTYSIEGVKKKLSINFDKSIHIS